MKRMAPNRSAADGEALHDTRMGALIEARGVHAHYGESHVLRGVSVAIGTGESLS